MEPDLRDVCRVAVDLANRIYPQLGPREPLVLSWQVPPPKVAVAVLICIPLSLPLFLLLHTGLLVPVAVWLLDPSPPPPHPNLRLPQCPPHFASFSFSDTQIYFCIMAHSWASRRWTFSTYVSLVAAFAFQDSFLFRSGQARATSQSALAQDMMPSTPANSGGECHSKSMLCDPAMQLSANKFGPPDHIAQVQLIFGPVTCRVRWPTTHSSTDRLWPDRSVGPLSERASWSR